jgi:hypothetical protein
MPLLDQAAISTITSNTRVESVAEIVKSGRCILFLGAGVHYPSPPGSRYTYMENECPPLGSRFSVQLA